MRSIGDIAVTRWLTGHVIAIEMMTKSRVTVGYAPYLALLLVFPSRTFPLKHLLIMIGYDEKDPISCSTFWTCN